MSLLDFTQAASDPNNPNAFPMTPQQIAQQQMLAAQLLKGGNDYSPVQSPWQGAARLAQALMGGWLEGRVGNAQRQAQQLRASQVAAMSGAAPSTPSPQTQALATALDPSLAPASAGAPAQHEAFIRDYAASQGVNPDFAAAVGKGEGMNAWSAKNPNAASTVDIDPKTGQPFSYGDFQLNVRNGLGNQAMAAGIDPRDPAQWQAADKFAIDQMAANGMRPWKGDAGVTAWGIGNNGNWNAPRVAPQTAANLPAPGAQADAGILPPMPGQNGFGIPGAEPQQPVDTSNVDQLDPDLKLAIARGQIPLPSAAQAQAAPMPPLAAPPAPAPSGPAPSILGNNPDGLWRLGPGSGANVPPSNSQALASALLNGRAPYPQVSPPVTANVGPASAVPPNYPGSPPPSTPPYTPPAVSREGAPPNNAALAAALMAQRGVPIPDAVPADVPTPPVRPADLGQVPAPNMPAPTAQPTAGAGLPPAAAVAAALQGQGPQPMTGRNNPNFQTPTQFNVAQAAALAAARQNGGGQQPTAAPSATMSGRPGPARTSPSGMVASSAPPGAGSNDPRFAAAAAILADPGASPQAQQVAMSLLQSRMPMAPTLSMISRDVNGAETVGWAYPRGPNGPHVTDLNGNAIQPGQNGYGINSSPAQAGASAAAPSAGPSSAPPSVPGVPAPQTNGAKIPELPPIGATPEGLAWLHNVEQQGGNQALVARKALAIISGQAQLPDGGGMGPTKPFDIAVNDAVFKAAPGYNANLAASRAKAIAEFQDKSTATSRGGLIQNMNTALGHLTDLSDLSEKLPTDSNSTRLPNTVINAGKSFTSAGPNAETLKAYNSAKDIVAQEVTKFYEGSAGTEADREALIKNLDPNASPSERRAAIATISRLIQTKGTEIQRDWHQAVGAPDGPQFDYPIYGSQAHDGMASIAQRAAGPQASTLSAARAAIARGAPRAAVIQRLQQNGVDPGGL